MSISEDGDYKEGSISDLLTLSSRLDVAAVLIGDACEYFEHEAVRAIHFSAIKGYS